MNNANKTKTYKETEQACIKCPETMLELLYRIFCYFARRFSFSLDKAVGTCVVLQILCKVLNDHFFVLLLLLRPCCSNNGYINAPTISPVLSSMPIAWVFILISQNSFPSPLILPHSIDADL